SSASDTTSRVEEPVTLPRTHTLVSVPAPAHTHSTLIHSTPGCNATCSSCTRARLRPETHTASRHPPLSLPHHLQRGLRILRTHRRRGLQIPHHLQRDAFLA